MKLSWLRIAAASAVVCIATWLALLASGNVGLQRSISKGAVTLFEQPIAVALVVVVAFVTAYVVVQRMRIGPWALVAGVLVGDVIAGLVLAPLAIGELEPIHAPLVVAAVSVLGLQPLAALAGAWVGHRRSRPGTTPA